MISASFKLGVQMIQRLGADQELMPDVAGNRGGEPPTNGFRFLLADDFFNPAMPSNRPGQTPCRQTKRGRRSTHGN